MSEELTGSLANIDILNGDIYEDSYIRGSITDDELIGDITFSDILFGDLSEDFKIEGEIDNEIIGIEVPVEVEEYDGDYFVTPRLSSQTLNTINKKMISDMTIYEIPITRTSNPYGGQTVLIG